ncbi:MAG: hypothetical protein A3E84_00305 [Gammaproteobacteria bacterium RIFCSPHIGHO2_12_FULL_42_13]|nr:MAG: hypothetical protein A3E84_00305 [Gammaproteobacteria bacterium RIFCSPHIGHO2_12_FULL_42_13]
MRYQHGFSLVELVVFIVVIGVALTGVMLAFTTALESGTSANPQTLATQLASARMDIILQQRRVNGFTSFNDPCVSSPPAVCPSLSGYAISSTITTYTISGDANYKLVDVTVSGPQNAYVNLKSLVGKY